MNFSEMDGVYARYPDLPRNHQDTVIAAVIVDIEHRALEAATAAVQRALYAIGFGDPHAARQIAEDEFQKAGLTSSTVQTD